MLLQRPRTYLLPPNKTEFIPRQPDYLLKRHASRGLVVVGISMDDDGWKSVKPWIQEKKVNYPIVIGNEALGKQYGLVGMR